MKTYVMMYCVYDADYHGHRIKRFEAKSFDEAEAQGIAFIEKLTYKGKFEYVIAESPSSYFLYNNETHKRA